MRISDWRSDVCASDLLSTPTRCCADRARALVPERGLHDTPRLGGGLALGEGVDMLHAFAHLAPDGVLAVEKACVVEADEELAVGAVGALRTRHRADAADMRFEIGRAHV